MIVFIYFILVVLMLTNAQKELVCPKVAGYVNCYVCTSTADSDDDFCGDPFNGTSGHANLTTTLCHGYCTKWVIDTVSGSTRITRLCSAALTMSMQKARVCMFERQSTHGILCFCDEDLCNAGRSLPLPQAITLSLLSYFLIS